MLKIKSMPFVKLPIFSFIGLLVFYSGQTMGQEKTEREFRVKAEEVPEAAKRWVIQAFNPSNKIKWFYEETSGKSSFEAKFSHDRLNHSVEFDLSGKIEDVEVQVKWTELPEKIQDAITAYFESKFSKFRIEKVQVQYTGEPNEMIKWAKTASSGLIQTRYEVEFYGESENAKKLWEGLFDENGKMLNLREIILPAASNLFF
ncbi:hypothetical protein [Cyclobacterium jeungdonense]|uniref:Uncharacterized protein n=1 Tax=Cyclobacterium jeungdonense TaxID=708087 RepID=A0ABT8CD78_9BACT|nr:hypothetical protein [Cyclobacterium jeungdonense]MDN3690758.1 hypothetical protein [Cyclobacterium jeungdonense]